MAKKRHILTTHLHKDFASLFDNVGLMLQVVFSGLTDVYLHALLRQTHTQKSVLKRSIEIRVPFGTETSENGSSFFRHFPLNGKV